MEVTVGNIIKIVLGVLVIVALAYGLYRFFSGSVMDFFKNIGIHDSSIKILLSLLI
jgi:hypothetical protein